MTLVIETKDVENLPNKSTECQHYSVTMPIYDMYFHFLFQFNILAQKWGIEKISL